MRKKGFTLIELLVVIAIIGTLASIVLVSMGGARRKARDAIRKADMRQLVTAQEMFYGTCDRYYLCSTTGGDCGGATTCATAPYPCEIASDAAASPECDTTATFLAASPVDPTNNATYFYTGLDNTPDDQTFCYYAVLENGAGTTDDSYYVAAHCGNFQFDPPLPTLTVPADCCP